MLCPQHMLFEMVSFSTSQPSCWNGQSHTEHYPKGVNSPSSDFFYLLVFVRLSHLTETIKAQGMKRPGRFTDHWLSFESLCLQIRFVRLQGSEVSQPCPRPLKVTSQLWGVNAHFSQLSRNCERGKGVQGSPKVTTLTKYRKVFGMLNCVIKKSWKYRLSKSTHLHRSTS